MSLVGALHARGVEHLHLTQVECLRVEQCPSVVGRAAGTGRRGRGPDEMTDELKRYWFVAAVIRQPRDLFATVAELGSGQLARRPLVVVANHEADNARKAVDSVDTDPVCVVPVDSDGAMVDAVDPALPLELRALLEAMDGREETGRRKGVRNEEEAKSQVYVQLRQDVADGALVLVASVANPEEQLQAARILLKGNCDCVLTHEIAARRA
jgi:hypothetical protein